MALLWVPPTMKAALGAPLANPLRPRYIGTHTRSALSRLATTLSR